jgi:hypothetical protein
MTHERALRALSECEGINRELEAIGRAIDAVEHQHGAHAEIEAGRQRAQRVRLVLREQCAAILAPHHAESVHGPHAWTTTRRLRRLQGLSPGAPAGMAHSDARGDSRPAAGPERLGATESVTPQQHDDYVVAGVWLQVLTVLLLLGLWFVCL